MISEKDLQRSKREFGRKGGEKVLETSKPTQRRGLGEPSMKVSWIYQRGDPLQQSSCASQVSLFALLRSFIASFLPWPAF